MSLKDAERLRSFADQAGDALKPGTPDGFEWGGSLIDLRGALLVGAQAIEGVHQHAPEVLRLRAFEKTVRAISDRLPDSTVAAAVEFFDAGLAAVFAEVEEASPTRASRGR